MARPKTGAGEQPRSNLDPKAVKSITPKYTFVTAKINWTTLLSRPKLWYEKGWGFTKLWLKLNLLRLLSYVRDTFLTPLVTPGWPIAEATFFQSPHRRKVMVVCEKDIGLFALLIHVLNAKMACSHSVTPVSVLVYWGEGVVYWCKRGFPVGSVAPCSWCSWPCAWMYGCARAIAPDSWAESSAGPWVMKTSTSLGT